MLQRLMSLERRKQLQAKIMTVFGEDMEKLSDETQRILADDLVTAFLNRLSVFARIEPENGLYTGTKRSLEP